MVSGNTWPPSMTVLAMANRAAADLVGFGGLIILTQTIRESK
jgi:hypothetical protein